MFDDNRSSWFWSMSSFPVSILYISIKSPLVGRSSSEGIPNIFILQSLLVGLVLQTVNTLGCSLLYLLQKLDVLYHMRQPCLDGVFHERSNVHFTQDSEVFDVNPMEVPFDHPED